MNMSGYESNYVGGKNDFESIIKGAGLEDGVISPELRTGALLELSNTVSSTSRTF